MILIEQAVDKAGKQTSKAFVKGKIIAKQKMAHAEISKEEPEIVAALEVNYRFIIYMLITCNHKHKHTNTQK